jgi:Holliday junction DNA helicase RuvA
MIAHLRGTLLEKHPTRVVVEVGGVGLELLVPLTTSQAMGEVGSPVSVHTVLVVREDALTLYGFDSPEQKALFQKLIGVSGVGPKTALAALSGSSPRELVAALQEQDLAVLTRLPGIGKKTAERMAVELKDGLAEFAVAMPGAPPGSERADAMAALLSLGYARPQARAAVEQASRECGESADVEVLIRTALARLSGGKRGKR